MSKLVSHGGQVVLLGSLMTVHGLYRLPEPDAARELREGIENRMTIENQMELGVILVKQAFSECPNYTKLVEALLREPAFRLYKTCRLTPGTHC